MKKNFLKNDSFVIIYIFLLLFAPPFVKNINFLLICFVFSSIVILLKYRNQIKEILIYKNIKKILKILILYYLWYFFTIIINIIFTKKIYIYNYFVNIYSIFLIFPILFICCLHIILYCDDKKISLDNIFRYIIIAGLIQSLITILSLLFPEIKKQLLEIMYNNTGETLYLNNYHISRRFYGFANSLLDSFGYGTGLLAIMPLFYSIKNGKKWLITIPFLLIVPFFNSRTGLVVFVLGFFIWIIYLIKNKSIKKYSKILICFFLIFVLTILLIYKLKPVTFQWIVNDIFSFFTDNNGTATVLFSHNFWKLPSFINMIFGTGYNIAGFGKMHAVLLFDSDVGYINEIWKTGIIGLSILLITFIKLIKELLNNSDSENKFFIISIFVITLIVNVKFYVFSYSPGITILILISLTTLLKNRSFKNNIEKNELISIIIPIYNVEKELDRCLNSVVNQTYHNLEIILVNDGSTDNSELICNEYKKKDNRIIYIKQKNKGLSAARNKGIEFANSNYYIFIDSDDFINLNFVEELYKTLSNNNADIAICDLKKVYDDNQDISKKQNGIICSYDGISKFYNVYNEFDLVTTVAWNKIYKKEIFKNIKYPVSKIHEDEFVVLELLDNANKVAYTSCNYYYYYQRANSITGSYSYKHVDILEAFKNKMNFFKKRNLKKLYSYALYDYYYQLYKQHKMLNLYYPNKSKKIIQIENEINKYKKEFFFNVYINPLKKVKILLFKYKIIK